MLKNFDAFLSARSSFCIGSVSLLLVAVVGVIDFATGYELGFSLFYSIPVGIGAWYGGKRLGFLVSLISAATWFAADIASGNHYSHPALPFWNAGVRLGFFVLITYLFYYLRRSLELQECLAQQDGLTGILNARTFKQRCDSAFALASRHGRPLALGYLDLDGFKGVNDKLGHSTGDLVLKEVATAITRRLRSSDFGGRLGGDEFAILLPETDPEGARKFFAGLRQNLIELAALNQWPVGFSIGVAEFPSPPSNSDEAIKCADSLMYRVKHSGKDNILLEEFPGGPRGD